MQDLKELNEVIAGIKDEICKGAETLTTFASSLLDASSMSIT